MSGSPGLTSSESAGVRSGNSSFCGGRSSLEATPMPAAARRSAAFGDSASSLPSAADGEPSAGREALESRDRPALVARLEAAPRRGSSAGFIARVVAFAGPAFGPATDEHAGREAGAEDDGVAKSLTMARRLK
jgi:hypothetical protein